MLPTVRSAEDSPHRSPSARNRRCLGGGDAHLREVPVVFRVARGHHPGRGDEPLVPPGTRLVEVPAHAPLVLDEHRVNRTQQPGDRVLLDVDGVQPFDKARVGPGGAGPLRARRRRLHGAEHNVQRLGDGPQARVRLPGYREGLADPLRRVRFAAEQQRHDGERHRQAERVSRVAVLERVAQRGDDVVAVGPQHRQPAQLVAGQQLVAASVISAQ